MLPDLFDWLAAQNRPAERPRVTLSYAQSLDGSLALTRGAPLALSGPESRRMTHELRCRHDAILVGIGTLLADNPRLNVRLAGGPDPRPVILDTHLRIPDGCNLLEREQNLPWIAAGAPVEPLRRADLERRGARVLEIERDARDRVDLPALLRTLYSLGIRSLMVEGGPAVISAFLRQRLVDAAVITLAPLFLGGPNLVEGPLLQGARLAAPALADPACAQLGRDLVVWGSIEDREL